MLASKYLRSPQILILYFNELLLQPMGLNGIGSSPLQHDWLNHRRCKSSCALLYKLLKKKFTTTPPIIKCSRTSTSPSFFWLQFRLYIRMPESVCVCIHLFIFFLFVFFFLLTFWFIYNNIWEWEKASRRLYRSMFKCWH